MGGFSGIGRHNGHIRHIGRRGGLEGYWGRGYIKGDVKKRTLSGENRGGIFSRESLCGEKIMTDYIEVLVKERSTKPPSKSD